jgi:cobalt-zinc-cadmium efflux system outer membrane protein
MSSGNFTFARQTLALVVACALAGTSGAEERSQSTASLTLAEARERARASSPALEAVREALAGARGVERQAGALPNPSLFYSHEQTSRGDADNRQDIAGVEQPIELGGQRGARRASARLQREAAEARLHAAELEIDFEVARAYAEAVAADRRAAHAAAAAESFAQAREISARRRERGDVSGYEDRRTALEAARYAALHAAAERERRTARATLAALVDPAGETPELVGEALVDSLDAPPLRTDRAAFHAQALAAHPEIRAAELEQQAAEADARVARRERVPSPVLAAGYKTERSAGGSGSFDGFTAGISVPLPLWDRGGGAIAAAEAQARRQAAGLRRVKRDVALAIERAWAEWDAAGEQLDAIRPQLGRGAEAALRAARSAYDEGEITLVEWLDAVRAYHEAESTYAGLLADHYIRRAALERAAGGSLP